MDVLLLDLGQSLRGGQYQVYYLAKALQNSEFKAVVACPRTSELAKLLQSENLPLLPLPASQANPWLWLKMYFKAKTGILHTHDAKAATVGYFCKLLHSKLILVHTRRVSYAPTPGLRAKKYFAAEAVVGVSGAISQQMLELGLDATKVSTIHSGLDPSRYAPKSAKESPNFVFQSIGALTSQKGYATLLEAVSLLKDMEDLPPFEVRIAGQGPLFSTLLQQAEELAVMDKLALLGYQDSRDILPLSSCVVVPSSDGEGSSGTIKEGWVTGVPVICSDLSSNTELVTDKIDGLTFKTGNALSLAAAMSRILQEPELRARLVERGQQTLQRFTHERMAEAYVQLYTKLSQGN